MFKASWYVEGRPDLDRKFENESLSALLEEARDAVGVQFTIEKAEERGPDRDVAAASKE